ncbi:MAG TPA: YabP/YqfC family sporulation protein [Pseudogracilibacillus sp.]|nr:YabP/YqfC family sporulation protein [Pseudogracilibacillus sp.]
MNEKKSSKRERSFIYKPFIVPTITIAQNNKITIEQAYQLLSYSTDEVTFESESGTVQVIGEALTITLLYEEQMVMEGVIREVRFLSS